MKKILIIGSGDHSKVILAEIIQTKQYQIIGFVDEKKKKGTTIETFRNRKYKIVCNITNMVFVCQVSLL